MASFSQGFLNNLGRPAMTQSLFDLGSAIGQAPSQYRAKKLRDSNAEELASIPKDSPEYFDALASQMEKAGNTAQGAKLRTVAAQIREKAEAAGKAKAEDEGVSLYNTARLQEVIATGSPEQKRQASAMLAGIEKAGTSAPFKESIEQLVASSLDLDYLVPVGKHVFDKKAKQFISPPEGTDNLTMVEVLDKLGGMYTADSLRAAYDPSTGKMRPGVELESTDSAGGEQGLEDMIDNIDNQLKTATLAQGLNSDVWGATYDIAKHIPLTDARQMKGLVDTLQAEMAFGRLTRMRKASKTGGALGQVSNIELDLLKASLTALDPGAGDDVFARQIETVINQYKRYKQALVGSLPKSGDGKSPYKVANGQYFWQDPKTGEWFNVMDVETSYQAGADEG